MLLPKSHKKCSIDGCADLVGKHGAKGMCAKHYVRVMRYGDPHYVTPESKRSMNNRMAQRAKRPAKPGNYVKFYGRHEHRVVAERTLGRALLPHEVVHHINGNTLDNRPENLEVTTQSHHVNEHWSIHLLTYKGITKRMVDWATEKGMSRQRLSQRIKAGWSVERALETPVGRENAAA
jgi:hypothetical protein